MGGGPPLTSLGFTDAWKILQKLGFSHSTSGYRFPGVRGRDGILGFNKFEHDHSLQEHLARFGYPITAYSKTLVPERDSVWSFSWLNRRMLRHITTDPHTVQYERQTKFLL